MRLILYCRICNKLKNSNSFRKDKSHKTGYDIKCKKCRSAQNKASALKAQKIFQKDNTSIVCKQCKQDLPFSNYTKVSLNTTGYNSTCKTCVKKRQNDTSKDIVNFKNNNASLICTYCNNELSLAQFKKSYQSKTGYMSICSNCYTSKLSATQNKYRETGIICASCKKLLSTNQFPTDKNSKTRHKAICKKCKKEKDIKRQIAFEKNNTTIKCRNCNKLLKLTHYFKDRTSSTGYNDLCKKCSGNTSSYILKLRNIQKEFMENNSTIICRICKKEKPFKDFYRNNQTKTRYMSECKECNKEYKKEKQKKFKNNNSTIICIDCKEVLNLNKFPKDGSTYSGFSSTCKKCSYKREQLPSKSIYHYNILLKYGEQVNIDKGGFIHTLCTNCNKDMAPTKQQIGCRIDSILGIQPGESNFYCSDKCKQECVLFNFKPNVQTDPRSNLYIAKSEQDFVRSCQTDHLKQLQIDEYGYTFCEKCGYKTAVDLHHTLSVSSYGKEAISSDSHILVCKKCHNILTKTC